MLVNEAARIGTPELEESYAQWLRISERHLAPVWAAAKSLPAEVSPHVLALAGFAGYSDHLADEGPLTERKKAFAQWRAQTLAEVRAGRSEHPLRRSLVHTMCAWGLDVALLEEMLDALAEDSAVVPAYESVGDQRRFLRGNGGTLAELWTPLLQPREQEAASLMSLLGEAMVMVDIFEDFPTDLAAGRCYVPGDDLRPLGLSIGDLRRGERREALDALVAVQVARARELARQAAPVVRMVPEPCQAFLDGILIGTELVLDEVEHWGCRVLAEGIDAFAVREPPPRRCAPADPAVTPAHIAVILDGNRRWAQRHGLAVEDGHRSGVRNVTRLVSAALRLSISHLSLFAFSTENWRRSLADQASVFDALAACVTQGTEWLHELDVRVRWCGRRDRLEESLASAVAVLENLTSNNTRMTLNVCLDYGGQEELVRAARALAAEAVSGTLRPDDISARDFARNLYLPDLPPVDLLVRTSGEQRISNFLPWHLAYAELHFEPADWPDFSPRHLQAALTEYAARQRRFGSDASPAVRLPAPATAL